VSLISISVLVAHLFAVYVVISGPFLVAWLAWRVRRNDDPAALWLQRRILAASQWALLGAVTLGGLALLLMGLTDRQDFFRAAQTVPARRYWFGIAELGFYSLCLLLVQRQVSRGPHAAGWYRAGGWWILPLVAGTNVAYHFPPLFVMISVGSARPETWAEPLRFWTALADPEVAARVIHHLLASVAVTGGAVLGLALRSSGEFDPNDSTRVAAWGARMALMATLLQVISGGWLLAALPAIARQGLLGGEPWATAGMTAALVTVVALLHALAAVSLGRSSRREVQSACLLLILVVVLMVAVGGRQ